VDYSIFQPPPRGLRLRATQVLSDRDGSCPSIYDLERGRLIEVPSEFQFHVAMALDTGNLDDDLVAWLAGEDLLSYENRPPSVAPGPWAGSVVSDGPLSRLDRVFVFEDEVHCRLGGLDGQTAAAAVGSVLARTDGGTRVVFHLTDEGLPALLDTLDRIVAAARRSAGRARSVDFELISDGGALTAPLVRFLAERDFLVRLTAPEIPVLDLLLSQMPERLTLSVVLDTGDRLLDLWQEARALGVHRLEAVKIADKPFAGLSLHALELRQYRRDLFQICDDMFTELSSGRQPNTVYEPLARVVGRHLAGRPAGRRLPGYLGVVAHGEVFPFFARATEDGGLDPVYGDDDADGLGMAAEGGEPRLSVSPCETCWGRELCTRGTLAGPAADPRRPEPRADRCEFWLAEVETGLLFYRRLQQADPSRLMGFAEGREEPVLDPYAHLGLQELKTC